MKILKIYFNSFIFILEIPGGKLIILYSEYGYIEVYKEDFESSDVSLIDILNREKNMSGKIKKSNLKKEIQVNIKTLYGDRRLYSYCIKIDDKISTLIKYLIEDEEKNNEKNGGKRWNKNYQYRLVTTNGTIRELKLYNSFYQENIKNNQTLILAPPEKLNFSEVQHGPGISIRNSCSTAYKLNGDEHQYAIANKGYSSGLHYCEFILETEPVERNIMIGVTLQINDYYFSDDSKNFWGYIPSDCKKIYNNLGSVENIVDYGDLCKMGDKVGLLMEFHDKGLNISFFVNKLDLGVAFKNLPLNNNYYPCVLLLYDGAKVKLTNRVPLPENIDL